MNFGNKLLENLSSLKLWVFIVASWFKYIDKIDTYTWAGVALGLMGVARVFEYFAKRSK